MTLVWALHDPGNHELRGGMCPAVVVFFFQSIVCLLYAFIVVVKIIVKGVVGICMVFKGCHLKAHANSSNEYSTPLKTHANSSKSL